MTRHERIAQGRAIFASLADTYGIKVAYRKDHATHGAAWIEDGRAHVIVPPIRGYVSLATALHEVGHILLGHPGDTTLPQELEAWGFARAKMDEAGIPWSPSVGAHAIACLMTHADSSHKAGDGDGKSRQIAAALRVLRDADLL